MSVDNSGVFLIGDNIANIDINNFPHPDQFDEDDLFEYFYWNNPLDLKLRWILSEPRGYERSGIFGFYLSSPSYGACNFDYTDFMIDIGEIVTNWITWTGNKPNVFVMNIQS